MIQTNINTKGSAMPMILTMVSFSLLMGWFAAWIITGEWLWWPLIGSGLSVLCAGLITHLHRRSWKRIEMPDSPTDHSRST